MVAPLVILSNCPWHSQWRRRQQLAVRLARTRPVWFLDPPRPALDLLRRRGGPPPAAIDRGVHVVAGPWALPAQRFSGPIQRANGAVQRTWAARWLHRLRREAGAPILLCYEPLLHPLHALGPHLAAVYDAVDDYAAYSRSAWLRPVLAARMSALAAECDLTLVTNETLAARLRPHARWLEILSHGVDTALFRPGAHQGTRFAALAKEPGPKAVYAGTLNHLIDLRALEEMARAGIVLLLAGECAWSHRTWARLRSAGDVRCFGSLPHAEVAALVAAADVGLLPYRPAPGLESAEPLKRLELLAAGLPIVAADVAPLRRHRDLWLATDPAAYVQAVRDAAAQPRGTAPAIGAEEDWDERAARLTGWLAALEARVTSTA